MQTLKKITAFCELFSTAPDPLLEQLERETHLKTLSPQMLSGRLQGQLISLLSQLMQPSAILEIGTFTGYATICLAQGLREGGILHTIEANPELCHISQKYFEQADLQSKIRQHIGDARRLIPAMKEVFDLVYLDAGKNDYALYYDLVFDKIRPGGILIADNVLWDGKLMLQSDDKDTRTIEAFNLKIQEDDRVENIMLPIRDGILIARKKAHFLRNQM